MSNLNEANSDVTVVDPDNWRAVSFTTGSSAITLDSVVIRGEAFSGGDEFFSLYDNSASNQPGSSVVSFLDNPQDRGSNDELRFSYNGTFELTASTQYWLVFGVNNAPGDSAPAPPALDYNIYWTSSIAQSGDVGWSIGDIRLRSTDMGSSWTSSSGSSIQFGIIVPEPSEYAFAIGLSLIAFITFRRMHFLHVKKDSRTYKHV